MIQRRHVLTALLTSAVLAISTQASATTDHRNDNSRPSTYVVSEQPGDTPEGIEVTPDGTIYVTSVGTGAVYRGSVRSPHLTPFLAAGSDGRTSATGVFTSTDGAASLSPVRAPRSSTCTTPAAGCSPPERHRKARSSTTSRSPADAVYVTDSALDSTWSTAEVVADSAPGAAGSTPTTVARDRGRLLWVNSQLDVAPGTPPYTVSVVPGLR